MDKLEKLKEVNKTINKMCIGLETRIFVEDMDSMDERIIKEYKPEPVQTKITL